jgi:hypothetical protein
MLNMFIARDTRRHEVGFVLPERVQREQGLLNASAVLVLRAKDDSSWKAGRCPTRVSCACITTSAPHACPGIRDTME